MRCPSCDAEIPTDGKFCIECGAPAAQAATGATERLPDFAGGRECAACNARNPSYAAFCVNCGRALASRPDAEAAANSPPMSPEPAPISLAPPAPAEAAPPNRAPGGRFSAERGGIMVGIWLIGIAVLAITRRWWPGIMVLLGISALVGGLLAGGREQRWGGIQGAIWMFGIAVLAATGRWWPGILVLVGISAIVGAILRNDKAS